MLVGDIAKYFQWVSDADTQGGPEQGVEALLNDFDSLTLGVKLSAELVLQRRARPLLLLLLQLPLPLRERR